MDAFRNKISCFIHANRGCNYSIAIAIILMISTGLKAQTDSILFDGMQRYYNVHVPELYGTDSVPLIIAIHGWARSPELMEKHTHLSDKADEEGFIVVYPKGTGSTLAWNTENEGINDAGYINALIDTMVANYAIDTNRIYVTGFSNGAELTYKVAQEYGQKIAAIAPVAADYWNNEQEPVKEMPIITFHAKNDGSVPISTVQPVLDNWIDFNNTSSIPDTFYLVEGATGIRWINEESKNNIVFFLTDVGGHSWPGGEPSWATPSNVISATDLMWDFFKRELPEVIELPTSLIQHSDIKMDFSIYPNPAKDYLRITGNYDNGILQVWSVQGILYNSYQVNQAEETSINISNLRNGIYFLTLITREGIAMHKQLLIVH